MRRPSSREFSSSSCLGASEFAASRKHEVILDRLRGLAQWHEQLEGILKHLIDEMITLQQEIRSLRTDAARPAAVRSAAASDGERQAGGSESADKEFLRSWRGQAIGARPRHASSATSPAIR